jgi:RecT family
VNALVPQTDTRPPMVTGGRIQPVIPQSMEDAYRLGKAIVAAGMAPRGMETPEKCMVAILRGLEVGLSPMQAVDKIAVVNGRPTIWGDGAMALVRASGLCEFVKERIDGDGDGRIAVCETKRRGEADTVRRTFSVSEAKEAGLWNKQGPWKQFPARMLQMRARAFALRDLYADVLGGLYLREEIEDEGRPGRADTPPPAEPRRQVQQQPVAQVIEHQPADPAADQRKLEEAEAAGAPQEVVSTLAAVVDGEAEDVVTKDSLLAELDDKLSYQGTADAIEEAYTDFDAEALLSDYEGGVEAARKLKAQHLDRVGPASGAAAPAPDTSGFPGEAAIAQASGGKPLNLLPPASDPFEIPAEFKGGGHYQIFIRAAAAAAKAPEDEDRLRKIWADTKPQRVDLAQQGQIDNTVVKLLLDDLQAAFARCQATAPLADDLPPPAPPRAVSLAPAAEAPPASNDAIAAYTAHQERELAACATKQDVAKWWASTGDDRDQTGANDAHRMAWKSSMQRRKADLPDAEG